MRKEEVWRDNPKNNNVTAQIKQALGVLYL